MLPAPVLFAAFIGASPCSQAFEALRYREAIKSCAQAIRSDRAQDARPLYTVLGMSFAAVGEAEHARRAFTSLLALDPTAELPGEVSPKIIAPFAAAKASGAAVEVRLSLESRRRSPLDRSLELRLALDDGPAHPVSRVELVVGEERRDLSVPLTSELITLDVPASGELEVIAFALDTFDGVLAKAEERVEAARPVAHAGPPPPRSLWLSFELWGGAALVAGAGGVVARVIAQAAHGAAEDAQFADAADAANDRASRAAVISTVSFVVAGVFALVALGLLVLEPESPSS
jgi:hypothetical protein